MVLGTIDGMDFNPRHVGLFQSTVQEAQFPPRRSASSVSALRAEIGITAEAHQIKEESDTDGTEEEGDGDVDLNSERNDEQRSAANDGDAGQAGGL